MCIAEGEKYSDKELFYVSMQGITHVKPDPSNAEKVQTQFYTLAEWMKQSTLFNLISAIKFFKYYQPRKVFQKWHDKVRYKIYLEKRRKFMNNLFFTKPAFAYDLGNIVGKLKNQNQNNLLADEIIHKSDLNFTQFKSEIFQELDA